MAKTVKENDGNNGKNGRDKIEKEIKASSTHFQQCMQDQIAKAKRRLRALIKRFYEKKQQKIAEIRKMLTEKQALIEQLQSELAELRRKQLRITKEIGQFEAEKKAVEEKAQKDIEALNQEASKHRIFLSTFPAMPVGCDFEIMTLPDFADLRLDSLEKNYLIIGSAVFSLILFRKKSLC